MILIPAVTSAHGGGPRCLCPAEILAATQKQLRSSQNN